MDAMRYDFQVDSTERIPAAGIVAAAEAAEAAGFRAFWRGESNGRDPIAVLGAASTRTSRIMLGSAILNVLARSPASTAMAAATLQELSGGRFLLGLGVGNRNIASWHGRAFGNPLRSIEEYVGIVRTALDGGRTSHAGSMHSSSGFKLAFTVPRVPIYLAALGPKMSELAGKVADGVLTNLGDASQMELVWSSVRRGEAEAGRPPGSVEVIDIVRLSVNEDYGKALDAIRTNFAFYGLADYYRDMFARMGAGDALRDLRENYSKYGFRRAASMVPEDAIRTVPGLVAATSVEEVRSRLKYFESSRADAVMLVYVPSSEDPSSEVSHFLRSWTGS
ncbi:MAG: LLM class flavin-dependent oxidoreductase [Conexivisphaera sp.]|jgi:alkanesulfonate monooxygenase SsuD/methylene tetrahydromethanopterin reductase-like flavin-dependent oxidoreductase (luciferase family)